MVDTLTIVKIGLVLLKPIGWIKDKWETVIGPWKTMPTLLQRIDALEERTLKSSAEHEWKVCYQLKDFGGGTFAYSLMDNSELPHHLCCPKCFDSDNKKSILQYTGKSSLTSQDIYHCNICKKELLLGTINYQSIGPSFTERRSNLFKR